MRRINLFVAVVLLLAGIAQAADDYPVGQLPGTVKPKAYRLALTIDPAQKHFSGHAQIDVVLTQPARRIFLHGSGLTVSSVSVQSSLERIAATYTEIQQSGVVRLDLPKELPAGDLTLTFDYTADFQKGAEGLFRAEVGGQWYAWTQMEPLDARRMFPGFDEPGFKTPFLVTVTAPKALKVFANAPLVEATPAGAMNTHRFAATPPLPTYLVALGIGDFDVVETSVPANSVRKQPLAMRVIATKGQASRMQFAAREAPKLVELTEQYVGIPYPYEKLDLLATPILGGAMENAGLIIFDDTLLLLENDAPFPQLRAFAEVTAHEIAHQWFGDLVTPAWWTDIWLNEAFAEWLGKKIGDQWRPDLELAASEIQDAFEGMAADSLGNGRPIRQAITDNRQVASAFDSITYKKGSQVLSMFETFIGPEKFAKGVNLHLTRYRHGNATADDFFRSLAEVAGNSKVVDAMRTFTDQTGVPMVSVTENANDMSLSQTRYLPLGVAARAAQTWQIPLCLRRGTARNCTLMQGTSITIPALAGKGAIMPNAGGAGYYRFRLDNAGWDRLIGEAGTLSAREGLALADSMWADFVAGTGSFDRVIAAARALSKNPQRLPALELAGRLGGLAQRVLTADELPQYWKLMRAIYGPRLATLGFDPKAGAHSRESSQAQSLRQSLVPVVALQGRDPALREQLAAAAIAYLDGNSQALDVAYRLTALQVAVQERGLPFMKRLHETMLKSTDSLFRQNSAVAIGAADTPELAQEALRIAFTPGMQSLETVRMFFALSQQPRARESLAVMADRNFKTLLDAFPGFLRPHIVELFGGYCSNADITRVERWIQPNLAHLGGGELELAQTKERIALCVALKGAKGEEIGRVLAKQARASGG
jgi:aminopeptidase N